MFRSKIGTLFIHLRLMDIEKRLGLLHHQLHQFLGITATGRIAVRLRPDQPGVRQHLARYAHIENSQIIDAIRAIPYEPQPYGFLYPGLPAVLREALVSRPHKPLSTYLTEREKQHMSECRLAEERRLLGQTLDTA